MVKVLVCSYVLFQVYLVHNSADVICNVKVLFHLAN